MAVPPSSREEIVSAALAILLEHGPLREGVLAAALKGKRLGFARNDLPSILSDPRLRHDEDGGWALVPEVPSVGQPLPNTMEKQHELEQQAAELQRHLDSLQRERDQAEAARVAAESEVKRLAQQVADGAAQGERLKLANRNLQFLEGEAARLRADLENTTSEATSRPRVPPSVPPGWQRCASGGMVYEAAPSKTPGEQLLRENLSTLDTGLVVLNAFIADGDREREVDAIVVHPSGVLTIEQKDTSAVGHLDFPVNGHAAIDGRDVGDWRRQAREQSQLLVAMARRPPAINVGFVRPIVSVHGKVVVTAGQRSGTVRAANVDTIADVVRDEMRNKASVVSLEALYELLTRLEIRAPAEEDIANAGFGD